MASHEFQFSLALSDEPYFEPMLSDVMTAVLGHVGYTPDEIAEMAAVVRDVLATGASGGTDRCHVAFEARGGELRIRVAYDGADEWRTTRPLP